MPRTVAAFCASAIASLFPAQAQYVPEKLAEPDCARFAAVANGIPLSSVRTTRDQYEKFLDRLCEGLQEDDNLVDDIVSSFGDIVSSLVEHGGYTDGQAVGDLLELYYNYCVSHASMSYDSGYWLYRHTHDPEVDHTFIRCTHVRSEGVRMSMEESPTRNKLSLHFEVVDNEVVPGLEPFLERPVTLSVRKPEAASCRWLRKSELATVEETAGPTDENDDTVEATNYILEVVGQSVSLSCERFDDRDKQSDTGAETLRLDVGNYPLSLPWRR